VRFYALIIERFIRSGPVTKKGVESEGEEQRKKSAKCENFGKAPCGKAHTVPACAPIVYRALVVHFLGARYDAAVALLVSQFVRR